MSEKMESILNTKKAHAHVCETHPHVYKNMLNKRGHKEEGLVCLKRIHPCKKGKRKKEKRN